MTFKPLTIVRMTMITVSSWCFAALLVLAIILLGIGKSKQVTTMNSYLLADRKTPLLALVATLVMTEFNTATLLSFSSAGMYADCWALSLPFVFLIGLLFYSIAVAKKWKEFNGVGITHFFAERYNSRFANIVGVILFTAMAGFSATYIKSITLIFSHILPNMNPWQLSAILTILSLMMTWRGGLMAIIRTDLICFFIILLFFPCLLYYTYALPGESTQPIMTLKQMQYNLPPQFVSSLILLTMFSYIIAPWYGQKIVSAESPQVARLAVVIAAVLIFLLYSLGVLATAQLSSKGIQLANPEMAIPYLIQHALPAWLKGIAYAVLFIITATTLTGVWSAMVTLLMPIGNANVERLSIRYGILIMFACGILTYLLANFFVDSILNKMILLNIPIVALSFSLLGGFYWKKTSILGAYVSVIVGLSWGFGCYFYYGEANLYTWYWAVYGIPLIFISGILASLFVNREILRGKLTKALGFNF